MALSLFPGRMDCPATEPVPVLAEYCLWKSIPGGASGPDRVPRLLRLEMRSLKLYRIRRDTLLGNRLDVQTSTSGGVWAVDCGLAKPDSSFFQKTLPTAYEFEIFCGKEGICLKPGCCPHTEKMSVAIVIGILPAPRS